MAKETKYLVVSRVYNTTKKKTYHPGQEIPLTPKAAGILLDRGVIEPVKSEAKKDEQDLEQE